MNDEELNKIKIPFWLIVVMSLSTIFSLVVLLLMIQKDFELEQVFQLFVAILSISILAIIFYFIKKGLQKIFKKNRDFKNVNLKQNDNKLDSEINKEKEFSDFISDNNVKLNMKESENNSHKKIGGNSSSDIFRY